MNSKAIIEKIQRQKTLLFLFGLALIAHAIFYGVVAVRIGNDALWSGPEDVRAYTVLAENLRTHDAFLSLDGTRPESWYTPGYPFILAVFRTMGFSWDGIVVLQILLASILPVLLFLVLSRVTSCRVAYVASVAFALAPSVTYISSFLYSEPWFLFFLLLHLYVVVRIIEEPRLKQLIRLGVVAGILLGMTIYVRSAGTYIIVAEMVMVATLRFQLPWRDVGTRLFAVGVAGVVSLLLVLPWSLRNHYYFGSYSLAATNSVVIYFYDGINFTAYQHAPSKVKYLLGIEEPSAFREDLSLAGMTKEYHYSGNGGLAHEKDLNERTLSIIKSSPIEFVFFHLVSGYGGILFQESWRPMLRRAGFPVPAMGMRTAIMNPGALSVYDVLWFSAGVLGIIVAVMIVCLGAYGVWVICRYRKERYVLLVMACMMVSYFSVISGAAAYRERYRYPATPFLLVLAVEGGVYLCAPHQPRRGLGSSTQRNLPIS